jgi:hypothetical protein
MREDSVVAEVHLRERGENAVTRKHVVGHITFTSHAPLPQPGPPEGKCRGRILLNCKAFRLRLC